MSKAEQLSKIKSAEKLPQKSRKVSLEKTDNKVN